MPKPNLFLVGAIKSGTSSMAAHLSAHPDVFMADKEPIYRHFIDDLHFRSPQYVTKTERRYLKYFSQAQDEKWRLDASPFYLYSRNAAERIREFSPDAKIVIMLRSPVPMMYSLHGMNLGNYSEDIANFEEALAAGPERERGQRIPKLVGLVESVLYRSWVLYAEQIERYFNVFGRENVHVILFDDFTGDTSGVYKKTLQFLQIDDSFVPEFRVVNPAGSNTKARAFLSLHPRLRTVVSYMPSWVRAAALKVVDPLLPPLVPQAKLSPEARKRLQAQFDPEIDRLEALLDRDLSGWRAEPSNAGTQQRVPG